MPRLKLLATVLILITTGAPAFAREPKGLFRDSDYPSEALKYGEQGLVETMLTIDVRGRVKACEIVVSSHSRSLDYTTCEVIRKRARFSPALDAKGKPVEGKYPARTNWVLPAR